LLGPPRFRHRNPGIPRRYGALRANLTTIAHRPDRDPRELVSRRSAADAVHQKVPEQPWLQLPKPIDSHTLFDEALQHGICFAPGDVFSASGRYAIACASAAATAGIGELKPA
jgi:hypothetical protein